jgi:hypothetical protein
VCQNVFTLPSKLFVAGAFWPTVSWLSTKCSVQLVFGINWAKLGDADKMRNERRRRQYVKLLVILPNGFSMVDPSPLSSPLNSEGKSGCQLSSSQQDLRMPLSRFQKMMLLDFGKHRRCNRTMADRVGVVVSEEI